MSGEVTIAGAKNAALGILAGAVMTNETVIIENVPKVQDVEYLLDANRQKYPLDKLLLRYAGYAAAEDEAKILSDDVSYNSIELSDEDILKRAFYCAKVREEQQKALDANGLTELFTGCEMPLTDTLARMELAGIKCEPDILREIGGELKEGIGRLEKGIYEEAGTEFNINSPKQLGTILFEKMGIPYPKPGKNKSGSYSTAADILDKLKDSYKIVADVLEYRKLSKLNSTYVEGLLPLIGEDGRVRPHFMQTVAATASQLLHSVADKIAYIKSGRLRHIIIGMSQYFRPLLAITMPPKIPPIIIATSPKVPLIVPTISVLSPSPPLSGASIRNGMAILESCASPSR